MQNRLPIIFKLLILLAILVGFFLFVQMTVDDAYICFRYGYNLFHYGIWNWNADHELIEAYTSFTYMMLSIIPPLIKVQPQIVFKIITFFFFLLIIRRIYLSIHQKYWAWLAILIYVSNWQTHVHVYAGLETTFWFWLLLEIFTLLDKNDFSNKIQTRLWLFALLLPLTRPEGAIFSAFIFVYIALIKKEKIYFPTLFLFGGIGVLYFVVRYLYFGLPLPLSFYHKSVGNNLGIWGYIYNTFTIWQYLIGFFAIFFIAKSHKLFRYSALLSFGIYYVFYGSSALLMNYANRFGFQIFYPIIILGIIVIFDKLTSEKKIKQSLVAVSIFLILITAKGLFSNNIVEISSIKNNAKFPFAMQKGHIKVGKAIKEIGHKNMKVLLGDAGVIPYIGDCKFYDAQGLADVYLSKQHINKAYFDSIKTDLVILVDFTNQVENLKGKTSTMGRIYDFIQAEENHTYIGTLASMPSYNLFFYVRNDSKYKTEIEQQIQKTIFESNNYKFSIKDFIRLKYLKI